MSTMPHPPSDNDLELLSAFIDGELTDHERQSLEQRLTIEHHLRAELESLQLTVALVRGLPILRAPRDFTLDPTMVPTPRPWWRHIVTSPTTWQISGALGTAASLVMIIAALLIGLGKTSEDASSLQATLPAEEIAFLATRTSSPLPLAEATLSLTDAMGRDAASAPPGVMQSFGQAAASESATHLPTASEDIPPASASENVGEMPAGAAAALSATTPLQDNASSETVTDEQAFEGEASAPVPPIVIAAPEPSDDADMLGQSPSESELDNVDSPEFKENGTTQKTPDDTGHDAGVSLRHWLVTIGAIALPISLILWFLGWKKAHR